MKKLFLGLCFIAFGLGLRAQDFAPYQKGESIISIRNPYYTPPQGSNTSNEYGAELEFHAFLLNNWSIGAGAFFAQSRLSQDEFDFKTRIRGFQVSTRYYAPPIKILTSNLNLFAELRTSTDNSFTHDSYPGKNLLLSNLYGGLGVAWRPLRFLSVDFTLQRGWQRFYEVSSNPTPQIVDAWNSSIGLNFHFRPKRR